MYKEGTLNDYMEILSKELSIFILLYPLIDKNNNNYMKMVYARYDAKLDEAVE